MNEIVAFFQHLFQALTNGQIAEWGFWSYFALGGLVLVEGPIATLLGAAAASAGWMNPFLVFVTASVSNLSADMLWYRLGYMGKIEWLVRYGRIFHIKRAHIIRMTRDMHKHARKMLLMAKLTITVAVPLLIATGVAKVPWRRWFWAVFAGEMIWTGSLVYLGFHFARSISHLESSVQLVALGTLMVFFFFFGRYMLHLIREWSDIPDLEQEAEIQE
jgi:membrane protein DedA with SNARE-associated domain